MSTYVHLPTEVQAFHWDGTEAGADDLVASLIATVVSIPTVYFPIARLTKFYSFVDPTYYDLQVLVDGIPTSVPVNGWVLAEPHKWPKIMTSEEFIAAYTELA